jgi:hypothetical protein
MPRDHSELVDSVAAFAALPAFVQASSHDVARLGFVSDNDTMERVIDRISAGDPPPDDVSKLVRSSSPTSPNRSPVRASPARRRPRSQRHHQADLCAPLANCGRRSVLPFGRVRGLGTLRLRRELVPGRSCSPPGAPCGQAPAFSLQIAR